MGLFGVWSLAGVHFLNVLFSYSDDFVLMRVLDFYTFLFWVYSDYDLSVGLWKVFPTYLKSFMVKTLANIWIIFIAIKYYDGWRECGRQLYKKTQETEQCETENMSGEDIIVF